MIRRSRARGLAPWVLGALAPLLAACFDVDRSAAEPRTIVWSEAQIVDDFGRGHNRSIWERFYPWQCVNWPDSTTIECGDALVDGGTNHGAALSFDVTEDYGGAGLSTAAVEPVDLTAFEQIAFRAQVDLTDGPDEIELRVQFSCSNAASPGISWYLEPLRVTSAVRLVQGEPLRWFALDLWSTKQPAWQKTEWNAPAVDPSTCLPLVDEISFAVTNAVYDELHGSVILDDVQLRRSHFGEDEVERGLLFSPWSSDPAMTFPGGSSPVPQLDFSFEPDALEDEMTCAAPLHLDPGRHTLDAIPLDLLTFSRLRFRARLIGPDARPGRGRTASALLWCAHPGDSFSLGPPAVVREFQVFPDWSSYRLPLDGFTPAQWAFGLEDPSVCLEQLSTLCFSVAPAAGEPSAGSVEIDELAFE